MKGCAKDGFIGLKQELGDQNRSDTVVVFKTNNEAYGSDVAFLVMFGTLFKSKVYAFWGGMVAYKKHEEFDERALQGVEPAA